ncbi:MAG: DUF262 domain-containing protein [Bacteroidota bacterium]|nr:DUF262 domain-containing protein [Bacteroidota bacterium]MDP3143835.1 DUF262 domain-containing protein [Bacteroidota bacterium]
MATEKLKDVNSDHLKLDKVIQKIEFGLIKIPPFQRKFVWDQNQIIELLDSIYNNYPIGSLLLWNTKDDLPSARNIGGFKLPIIDKEYPVDYVLDGQQRITSAYGCLCKNIEQEVTDYSPDPELFDIYFELSTQKFIMKESITDPNNAIAIRLLFDNQSFLKRIMEFSAEPEKIELASKLQSTFSNYEVPIVTIKGREKAEVGIIFERINNTGTELSTLDLMIAWTWTEEYHLKEELDEILETLSSSGFGDVKDKIVLQCLSAIIKKTTSTKEILNLKPDEVRSHTKKLGEALELTIDFISTQFKIQADDFLPNSHQIVPLTYFFSKKNHVAGEQSECLKKWFWRTSFSNRYSDSTDAKMNDDIIFMDEILNNNFVNIDKYKSSVDKTFFKTQNLLKSNPHVRAYLLLLAQQIPFDLTNGQIINIDYSLSSFNRKEYHHIFPKNFLSKKKSLKTKEINIIANFCFLPANSNKKISNRAPSEYFKDIIPTGQKNEILNSNLIPNIDSIYSTDDFNEFINHRAEIIYSKLKLLTGE